VSTPARDDDRMGSDGAAAPEATAAEMARGRFPAAVEETLANLPSAPGCYLFKDAGGTVLYVGKARVLRDRVRSYFRNAGDLSLKNRSLVPKIAAIDLQIVGSENEALLLEHNLIKQYRPRYNVLLRDDKTYLSLKITDEPYPRIEAVRRRADDGARYFGPYTSSQSVYRTLDLLKKLFPYRSCRLHIVPPQGRATDGADALPETPAALRRGARARRPTQDAQTVNARGQRPPQQRIRTVAGPQNRACLEYHIHRCAGPCIDAVSREDYASIIEQAALFLQGKSEQVLTHLQRGMEAAAEELDFERAARLRDQIEAVRRVTERQRVTTMDGHDRDVVGMARVEDETCVELITVREGRMLGHKQFVLQGTADKDDGEVLRAFITQFYLGMGELPEELLLPADPEDAGALAQLLSGERGHKMTLAAPQRGDKRALVEMAQKNAHEAAEQRRLRSLNDTQKTTQALGDLQRALDLPRLPLRIECYDIATIQGTSTVGSMVVFENGKPKTAAYRRFHIKTVTGTDDFASMAEMLRRRLKRGRGAYGQDGDAQEGPADVSGDPLFDEGAEQLTQRAYADADDAALEALADGETLTIDDGQAVDALPDGEAAEQEPRDAAGATTGTQDAGDEWTRRPDLLLIDGGKGQLSAVLAVLQELGITDQPIASLAKQEEEIFLPGRAESIRLPMNSQALFLVQRVRDEAHRFANTFHRNTRSKRSLQSSLDAVPGIGSRRKRDLLRHFGSLAALRRATADEIAAVPGIGPKTAQTIKDHIGDA
jgi:excinuclease ABC subunit C